MRSSMVAGALVAAAAGAVAVHGQSAERYEVDPMEKGRKLGVAVYRVQRQQPTNDVGSDYEIEIVNRSQAVTGTVRFSERPAGVTMLMYTDTRTGRRLEARYGPGYRWLELRDPQTGTSGRSDLVEHDDQKPAWRKNEGFVKIETERRDDWEQMFEAATAVSTDELRRKERYEREHGPARPMKPRAGPSIGLVLASAAAQNYCGGMASCRGVSYAISKSICCAAAKQSASNCCGMNQYCIGCCAYGSCDSYCAIGDYACPICGVSGARCSAPVSNCYGNVSCPPNYMCSGTGCIPMF